MEFSEPTASVPSNHNQFSVAFTTNIAESNFRYTQDQEPAVAVRQPDPALHLTPQNNQLTAKRRILSFKPALRLERRGQNGQDGEDQSEHGPQTLGDSFG